jgi:hypothetical protein
MAAAGLEKVLRRLLRHMRHVSLLSLWRDHE